MKFRKKPVVIEADKWDPKRDSCMDLALMHGWKVDTEGNAYIDTLEGTHKCNVGDWVIRGIKGEYYPCKPDIFEASYEPV